VDGAEPGEPGAKWPGADVSQLHPVANSEGEEAIPTSGESGWVQPGAGSGLPRGARIVLSILVWLGAAFVLALAGWVVAKETVSPSVRPGYVIGTVVAGLGLPTILRWIWLRVRPRAKQPRRLLTPWIPVIGVALSVGVLAGETTPAAEVDPETMFNVGPGYTLTAADPAIEADVRAQFNADPEPPRALAVRNIEATDGTAGFLIVADMRIKDVSSALALEGMMAAFEARTEPQRVVVRGVETLVTTAQGVTIVSWVDSPLVAILYAPDGASGSSMAESIIRANE
jgi:hypothetical protein